jgi:hypothetical protein
VFPEQTTATEIFMKAAIAFDLIYGVGESEDDAKECAYEVISGDIDAIRAMLDNQNIFNDNKWKFYGALEGAVSDMECVEMTPELAAAVEKDGYEVAYKKLPDGMICVA